MKKVRVTVMQNCDGYKSLCIEEPDGSSGTRVAGPKIYYDSTEVCHFLVGANELKRLIDGNAEDVDE